MCEDMAANFRGFAGAAMTDEIDITVEHLFDGFYCAECGERVYPSPYSEAEIYTGWRVDRADLCCSRKCAEQLRREYFTGAGDEVPAEYK